MIHIGADTHKEEHAVVVLKDGAHELGRKMMKNVIEEYPKILEWAKKWGEDILWGLENTGSWGKTFSEYLIEQGETVYEIPANLTARQRRLGTRKDKTDFEDALSIARNLYIEEKHLVPLTIHKETSNMRIFTLERDNLIADRTRYCNRLHKELLYIDPCYKKLIGNLKTAENLIKCREFVENYKENEMKMANCLVCIRLLNQIELLNTQIQEVTNQIEDLVKEIKSPLKSLKGLGDIRTAQLLGEIGDIKRFSSAKKLAKFAGIAPVELSSGKKNGHRVNTGGNRRLNHVFHCIALSQKRYNPEAKSYYERKLQEGKTKRKALRCLKRKLVDIVFAMLRDNQEYRMPEAA